MRSRVVPVVRATTILIFLTTLIIACSGDDDADVAIEGGPTTTEGAETTAGGDSNLPTLKLGAALPFTGIVAEPMQERREAFEMYVEEQGGTLGGLPVEIIWEDTETDAETAVTKVEKLINSDGIHLLTEGGLAFETAAYANNINEAEIGFVGSLAADELSRLGIPYILNASKHNASAEGMPLGTYAYEELGYRTAAIVAQDYQWGWQVTGGFHYAFEAAGGKVVSKVFTPIGTSDYAPFVSELPKDVDVVFATVVGADVPRFVQAYNDFGFTGTVPLLGSEDLVSEDAIRYYGDDALGIHGITPFSPNLDRPEMKAYVDAYRERTGNTASFWGEMAYVNALTIDRLLWYARDEVGIAPEELPDWVRNNALDFIALGQDIDLSDTPSSAVEIDDLNNAIRDFYFVELVKSDEGRIVDEVRHTFEQVGQFWIFDPEEFLANPVFSREFPPVT